MDSGSSCLCDSSDPTDPTEYLEILKKKYLERTAKLQAQQRELEQKIVKMEAFIGKSKDPSKSFQSSCQCTSPVVPKVFPETPVRDVPTIPETMTNVIPNQQPVSQQCSFFQKMMENAKNILSLSCQCPTSPNVTQATATETPTTTNATTTPPNTASVTPPITTTTATDATYSELPTKDNDRSEQQNVVDYDNTLTDKSSRTSTCTCDFSDPSTLQEASCSCHIADPKAITMQQGQQVSIEHSSSSPKEHTDGELLTSSVSKSEKCPWKNTVTSELISEECSCELCKCTSSLIMDGKQLDTDNAPADTVLANSAPAQGVVAGNIPEENITLPTVTVFLEKRDSPDAGVQVAATVETKGVHSEISKDTANKCVTCCRNAACPRNNSDPGKGDNLCAGVQVAASTTNKGVNIQQPASVANIGTDKSKLICRGRCNPGAPPKERRRDPNQDQQVGIRAYNQDLPNRQDGQNQCAFVGSPLLTFDALGTTKSTSVTGPKSANTATSSLKLPCNCNTPQGPKKICPVSNFSLNSNDILEMQTIAELAKKEKEMKAHIADLQKREKQYQEATRNVETLASKTNSHCCCCSQKRSPSMDNDIERISRELRLENQILKSELEDMKMELKHCLEKIEGPMKHKLETEKQKCECLQRELQAASKNMLVNQDANAREMNQLKLQLCCACNNITELNQMNTRLKDEMSQLDCLCQKLEDDLIKQKVSEAETIKRLTGRKYGGEAPRRQPSEEIRCESSLDLIARKLSKTLKELGPCDECSKLPTELAGAARCIKDLTDMVRKRKTKSLTTNACSCQSRPPSQPLSKSFSEEDECCTCCGPRDGGGESARKSRSPEEKVVKTLHQVPVSFVQKDQSSKFDVHPAQSSYYSAQGEPVREAPCPPCFQSKATLAKEEPPKKEGKRPCGDIGEPCRTAQSTSKHKPVQVTPKEDKICRAPCSGILSPVKDEEVQEALDAEKEPGSQEKPVQVPEEARQADKGCSASCEFMKKVKSKDVGEKIPSKAKSLERTMPSEKGDEPITEETEEEHILSEEKEIEGIAEEEPPPEGVEGEPKLKEKDSKVEEGEAPEELEKQPVIEEMLASKEVKPIEASKSAPVAGDIGKTLSSISSDKKHTPDTTLGLVPEEITESAPDTTHVTDETSSPRTDAIIPEEPVSGARGDSSREGVKDLPRDDTDERTAEREPPHDKRELKQEPSTEKRTPSSHDKKELRKEPSIGKPIPDKEYEPIEHPTKQPLESHDYAKPDMLDTVPELSGESGTALDTSVYDTDQHEALSHERVHIGEREIPIEEKRFGGEFPVEVGNKAFVVDDPPPGLHITTTITGSGTLEVITEGPGGSIETTLIYTEEGNIEVITEMIEHPEDSAPPTDQALEKFATKPSLKVPRVPSSTRPCTPGPSCEAMKEESGYVICDPQIECHDRDKLGKPLLKAIPVDSSAISGVSGPEAETPYTPSSVTGDDDLTSKLATDSSGIKPVMDQTADLTSAYSKPSVAHRPAAGSGVQAVPTMSPIPSLGQGSEKGKVSSVGGKGSEVKAASRADTTASVEQATFMYDKSPSTEGRGGEMEKAGSRLTSPSGREVAADQVPSSAGDLASSFAQQSSHQQGDGQENLTSEALTSTTGELKSGDVFTPDQVGSEPEMQGSLQDLEAQIIEESFIPQKTSKPYELGTAPSAKDDSGTQAKVTVSGEPAEQAELVSDGDIPTVAGMHVGTGEPPLMSGIASSISGQVRVMSGTSTASKGQGSEIEDQITALRVKKSLFEEVSQKAKTGSFEFKETDEKIAIPDDSKAPVADSSGPRATRDCSCQSKDQTNQSCQCCECKTIGVTTSGDKETTTEKDEEMGKAPHEEIEGTKTDTDSEFVTISENIDHAIAQRTSSKKAGDTLDDASSMPLSPSPRKETGSKTSDWHTLVDEDLLEKHPELRGKTSSEQERLLKDLGYLHDKGSRQIAVDEQMLEKHPELAGKTPEEQQAILKDLGYAVSEPKLTEIPGDHPSKDFEEQQHGMTNIIYSTPPGSKIKVTEDLLLKHPELADKDSKEQQEILKSLGFSFADMEAAEMKTHPEPAISLHEEVSTPGSTKVSKMEIDPELLEKHPELIGKTSEEQRQILQGLGYSVPEKVSAPVDKSRSSIKSKVRVDSELLRKHPELLGKDSNEQRKMLADLGYTTSEPVAGLKPEILASHPELAGKTIEEQKELLQNMGYILDEVFELAVRDSRVTGVKPSGETFTTPQPSSKDVSVSCKAPCRTAAVQDDIPKEPSDAAVPVDILESGADEPADIPKEVGDSAVSADIPKKTSGVAVPTDIPKKPSGDADIPKKPSEKVVPLDTTSSKSLTRSRGSAGGLSKEPSSKEVSITCRAPCKSAATLHITPQKQSEKSISAVGTVSSTTFSKSRTVSLQQTPSSRDDSASCKASCRTMSVQSSGSRLAQARREVREIVTSRTESSTTASSSDARSKEKSRKRDKAKTAPGEVPYIVSELSDKDRPAIESTKKPKSTRKKRMKAYDCMKCDCNDPCKCSVCAPERRREPLKRPARSCECPPNVMMIPPMVVVPQMPMTYSMPPTGHAANCRCNACMCAEVLPPRADEQRRPQTDFVTSDENEGRPKKHPPNCECVDCLCLPKIKKIANTKEYPVVYDKKQVYQVKVKCDTCTNAQNARRYLEQQAQSRSRIPISTTSANPPRVRSDPKQAGGSSDDQPAPAEGAKPDEPPKEDDQKAGAAPLSASESVYNSVACDCPDCVCSECPDEKKRPPPKAEVVPKESEKGVVPTTPSVANAPQGDKNCCCKEKPCVCDPCTVEELTKKLKEAEEKLAAAKSQIAAQPSVIQGKTSPEQEEECNCEICICPRSDLMPSKQGKPPAGVPSATKSPAGDQPPGDDEPCTCVECVCPGADQMAPTKVPSAAPPAAEKGGDGAHPDDCTCPECNCPGINDFKAGVPKQPSAAKQPSAIKPPDAGAGDEECDCKECVCPGKDQMPGKARAGDSAPADLPVEACDCTECKCSPCADPKKQAQKPPQEQPPGIADCDCVDCQCTPCADPKRRKDIKKDSKTDQPGDKPHSDECDCATCECPGEVPPTTTTATSPTTPTVKDAPTDTGEVKHGDDCDCPECACPYSPSKAKEGVPAKESKFTDMPEKVPHPADCDCDECLCLEEILQKEVVAQTEKGVQPQAEKEVHSSNCVCPECLCPECSTKATHAPGCMCGECVCSPCDKKEPVQTTTGATQSVHDAPGQAGDQKYHPTDCTCIECVCDACTDPSKKTVAVDDQPHADGCRCDQCLCNECPMMSAPPRHHEGCQCPQCVCIECPKMASQAAGEQPQAAAPAAEEPAAPVADQPQAAEAAGDQPGAVPSSAGEKEDNCICENCICIECKGKGKGEKAGTCTCPVCECLVCDKNPPAEKSPQGGGEEQKQRSGNCKCETCICDPCIKEADEPCKCTDCQCVVCDKKPVQSAAPPQEGGGEQKNLSENCKCATCVCDPCEKNPEEPCKCPDCQCLECDKKKEQTAPKAGDQSTHSPACICSDCRCKPCFNMEKAEETCSCPVCTCVVCSKNMSGKTPQPIDQQAPPSTTQQETIGDQCRPEGDDCTCTVCTCLECSRKRPKAGDQEMGEKETHSPLCECSVCQCKDQSGQAKPAAAAGEGLDFTDPPPFEPLQRIDCNCNQCGCVICSMNLKAEEATQEGLPSVKKSSAHGATAPSSTDQNRSGQTGTEQQQSELPEDSQPPPFEAPFRIDCICNRCSCIFCNKEAPQRSVAAQPSIVSSAVQKAASVQPSLTAPTQTQQSVLQATTSVHGTTPSQAVTGTQSQCAVMQAASQVAAAIAASQPGQLAPPTAESQLIYQIAASQQAVQAGPSQMQAMAASQHASQVATSATMSQQITPNIASQMIYQTAASQHAAQAAASQQIPLVASQQAAAAAASQQAAAAAASQQAAMIAASQQIAGTAPSQSTAQAAACGYVPLPGQLCADAAASQTITGPAKSKIVTAAAPSKLRFQIPASDTTTIASQQIYQAPGSQQNAAMATSQQIATLAASQQAAAVAASQQAAVAAASQQIPGMAPSNLIYQAAQSQQIPPGAMSGIIPPVIQQQEAICPSKICSQIPPSVLAALIAASQQGVPTSQIAAQLAASQQITSVGPSQMFAPAIVGSQQVPQTGASQMVTPTGASQMITPVTAASQQISQPGISHMMTPAGSNQQGVRGIPSEFCTKVAASLHAFQEGQQAYQASQQAVAIAASQQAAPTVGSQMVASAAVSQQAAPTIGSQMVTPSVPSQQAAALAVSQHAAGETGGGGHPPGCNCNLCTCGPCSFGPDAESVLTGKESKPVDVIKPPGSANMEGMPLHCNCPTCTCDEGVIQTTTFDKTSPPTTTVVSGLSSAPYSSTTATTRTTGTVPSGASAIPGSTGEVYQSAETLVLPKPDVHKMYPPHPPECDCKQCLCMPCKDANVAQSGAPTMASGSKVGQASAEANVKAMDDVTLVRSIQAANQESGAYKGQIDEIKKTLDKIKCACTEAEFRSTQSMGQSMSKEMGQINVKPFVKQASVFGQTMSGLKMALNNLQAKCKAKDRMIEAMTTELQQRGTSEVFTKVMDMSGNLPSALDYDTAEDVKSLERSQIATNVIHAPPEVKDEGTTPSALKVTASKGVEVRTHKHKKRKEKQSDKDPDCVCSKHQLIQKEEKDCQKLDLAGFEVVDIRRITDDSLIVKWNAPKNDQVQGYDIFVNGTLASKVMSGTRTSAMMHSLDLSKSVQITIYAVTGCGRVEPPAIAIYEIKS